jgi:hypothetical protein
VHRDLITKVTNKMQLYKLIHYSYSALQFSGDVFAHHHEHLTVFTASGIVHPSCCPAGVLDGLKLNQVLLMMDENVARNM